MSRISWPEAWFSRRTFYLSGEISVRKSATDARPQTVSGDVKGTAENK